MRNLKGQFIKGSKPANGFKKGNHPKTQFGKGHNSWNTGNHIKLNDALDKWHKNYTKEKHYNWKGGISVDVHSITEPKYKKWRMSVFERDNWTCQGCGLRGCYLQAHHIKSWAKFKDLRYDINNGVTLCLTCHSQTDNYKGKRVEDLTDKK